MSHSCEFIHIICTEPRIQKFYHQHLEEKKLWGSFDTIQYENPLLDFLDKGKLTRMIARIKAYRTLHNPTKIVLFDHFDCGAYKLAGYQFSSFEEETRAHQQNNQKITSIIKEHFPDMAVEVRYIIINQDGNCEWFEI